MVLVSKHWNAARIIRTAAAVVAIAALSGCMFGDESPGIADAGADAGLGSWYDPNCVPWECLYQCCQGWNYSPKPHLGIGNVPGTVCEDYRKKNPAYADYATLMKALWNYCTDDFTWMESGYCYPVQPTDAIKEAEPGKQPIYSTSNFSVCAPRGQFMAFPMQDVEIIPKAEE